MWRVLIIILFVCSAYCAPRRIPSQVSSSANLDEKEPSDLAEFREKATKPLLREGGFNEVRSLITFSDKVSEYRMPAAPCVAFSNQISHVSVRLSQVRYRRDHEPYEAVRNDLEQCVAFVRRVTYDKYLAHRAWAPKVKESTNRGILDAVRVCIFVSKDLDLCRTTYLVWAARWSESGSRKLPLLDRNRDDLVSEIDAIFKAM